jgi:biotin transporter BioY
MKLFRFIKNIWTNVMKQMPDFKEGSKTLGVQFISCAVVAIWFYILGIVCLAFGLGKYIPKESAKDDAFLVGALATVAMLVLFAIFTTLLVTYIKLKKIWNES